jgi:transposase-like protein
MTPTEVTTGCAAAYPPALATVLPEALPETGKLLQRRVERDHQHRKGRTRGMRGFKTLAGARVLCRAPAFLRNLRGGCYDLEATLAAIPFRGLTAMMAAWGALTADLLTW